LIGCLNDEDSELVRGAIWSLGKIGDRRAVGPLIGCLSGRSTFWKIKAQAVAALDDLKDRKAIEPLMAVLMDKDNVREVRLCAYMVLRDLQTPAEREILLKTLRATAQAQNPPGVVFAEQFAEDAADMALDISDLFLDV
jgi:HEAT repeat protein